MHGQQNIKKKYRVSNSPVLYIQPVFIYETDPSDRAV